MSFLILGMDIGYREEEIMAFAMLVQLVVQSVEEALTMVAAMEVHSGRRVGRVYQQQLRRG